MSGPACVFGEVLFDHFPDGRRVLGGAPFNVAWHLQAFGEPPLVISRVGEDADGAAVREAMSRWGMTQAALQTDAHRPTGRVGVSIARGEPSYDIVHPAAWDGIEAPSNLPAGPVLYHGSLALRSPVSRRSCDFLRKAVRAGDAGGRIFVDVNLRQPWFQPDSVRAMLEGSHWVKLNRQELETLFPGDEFAQQGQWIVDRFGLDALLLTDGANGASLHSADGGLCSVRPDTDLKVVDTVGAGDAMASVVLLGLMRGWPSGLCLERAQSFASAIVGQQGATVSDPSFYARFIREWSLDDPPAAS
jgi:fructokinase